MILLNSSHLITDAQRGQIEALTGAAVTREIAAMPQFDEQQLFIPQLDNLLDQIPLAPAEWQGEPILVVLPSLNFIAALLLADLHGHMGYFLPVVRTRPIPGAVPRRYEVAEIIDLQAIREEARRQR